MSRYEISSELCESLCHKIHRLYKPSHHFLFNSHVESGMLWITRCLGISTMMMLVHKLTPSYSQSQLFRKSFPRVVNFFVKRYTSSYHDLGWHKNQIFVFTLKTPMQPKKSSSFDRWDKNMSQKCRILGYGDLYP